MRACYIGANVLTPTIVGTTFIVVYKRKTLPLAIVIIAPSYSVSIHGS